MSLLPLWTHFCTPRCTLHRLAHCSARSIADLSLCHSCISGWDVLTCALSCRLVSDMSYCTPELTGPHIPESSRWRRLSVQPHGRDMLECIQPPRYTVCSAGGESEGFQQPAQCNCGTRNGGLAGAAVAGPRSQPCGASPGGLHVHWPPSAFSPLAIRLANEDKLWTHQSHPTWPPVTGPLECSWQ